MQQNIHIGLDLPAELPIARYRFRFLLNDDLITPPYAGSTLRGVFGHSLRRLACMTRQRSCTACPLIQTCPYSTIFETPADMRLNKSQAANPPQPYIIEAPLGQQRQYAAHSEYVFSMVLLGNARHQLPLITYAFKQAFLRGITARRSTAELADIEIEGVDGWQSVYRQGCIVPHDNLLALPQHYPLNAELHFYTPLRIQKQGSVLGIKRLTVEALLSQLLRRTSALSTLYWRSLNADYAALTRAAAGISGSHELQWQDWSRYSNRQQQEMVLGGAVGVWRLYDLPLAFAQLLHLGQWLHVGKETVFGHGGYTLKPLKIG